MVSDQEKIKDELLKSIGELNRALEQLGAESVNGE
jgi:hypothetical protein